MKKLTILTLVGAASALTLSATAASAQPPGRWMSINERQARLDHRIDNGVRDGSLTRFEARRLRTEFRQIARREARYRVDGLSRWERADLDRRFDRLSAQIHGERHDYQTRG
ncbi:MAG TPA: hypothetical protein VIE16_05205 [Phenylobacterium sp.]|jgi:hypothetical protein